MYDNGFARAQRSYDAQEPPDYTNDWEAYSARYDTPENDKQLTNYLLDSITEGWSKKDRQQIEDTLRNLLTEGIKTRDIDGKDKLYAFYSIAPSFDTFCEDRADDGPDPDRGRDD